VSNSAGRLTGLKITQLDEGQNESIEMIVCVFKRADPA
jgi:hypothetical protein